MRTDSASMAVGLAILTKMVVVASNEDLNKLLSTIKKAMSMLEVLSITGVDPMKHAHALHASMVTFIEAELAYRCKEKHTTTKQAPILDFLKNRF